MISFFKTSPSKFFVKRILLPPPRIKVESDGYCTMSSESSSVLWNEEKYLELEREVNIF